jgi:hypothetical protein
MQRFPNRQKWQDPDPLRIREYGRDPKRELVIVRKRFPDYRCSLCVWASGSCRVGVYLCMRDSVEQVYSVYCRILYNSELAIYINQPLVKMVEQIRPAQDASSFIFA